MTPRSTLTGIQFNCRSLNTGLVELKLLIYSKKPDFVALCETWINVNSKYIPSFYNYCPVWKHRLTGTGGGLCILVKRGVQYQELNLNEYQNGLIEIQGIRLFESNQRYIDIVNVYNPNKNVTANELRFYINQLSSKFVICGDFNAHSRLLNENTTVSNQTGRAIETVLDDNNVCLINPLNFYTRINVVSYTRSCLDLCFSSPNIASDITLTQLADIGSDHLPILISIQVRAIVTECSFRKKWRINVDRLDSFSRNIKSSDIPSPNTTSNLVDDITCRIYDTAVKHIGLTSGKMRSRKRTPCWTTESSRVVAERRRALKILEREPLPTNANIYLEKARIAQALLKKNKRNSFKKFITDIKYDTPTGEVWKKFRSLKGYTPDPLTPILSGSDLLLNPEEKVEAFVDHYMTVSNLTPSSAVQEIPDFHRIEEEAKVDCTREYNSDITIGEMNNALSKCRDTSPGKDNITYLLVKNLNHDTYRELLRIFNQCFSLGEFPSTWKEGLIVPIKKPSKPPEELKSYRPITLLSCLGKLFERIIQARLEYHLENTNCLSETQFGFRKGRGTINCLLRLENTIKNALASNEIVGAVYIDLTSAFDTVWIKGLKFKLIRMGVRGRLYRILCNFLENRKIYVMMNNKISTERLVRAGTPQGSVLSPILFNVMLSDIPQRDGIEINSYADDITISCKSRSPTELRTKLQDYLRVFEKWAKDWGLRINPSKCAMQYFFKRTIPCPILRIGNTTVEYVKEYTLLGLVFDSPKLDWGKHIEYLIRNCDHRLNIMRAIAGIRYGASARVLRQVYIAYIRAKIDYGSVVYSSAKDRSLQKLETIQNKAMRIILGARKTSPISSLQAESFLPPLRLHRGSLHVKQYIKLKCEPGNCPTSSLLAYENASIPRTADTFCVRAGQWRTKFQIQNIKRNEVCLYSIPPWEDVNSFIMYGNPQIMCSPVRFQDFISDSFPDYNLIFTDGSKVATDQLNSVGCASYNQNLKTTVCWKLNPSHSVLAAELYAIYRTLYLIQNLNHKYVIFTDSQASLQLISKPSPLYLDVIVKIRRKLCEINSVTRLCLHWIKGHSSIHGNEVADRAANLAHYNNRSEIFDLTQSEYVSQLKVNFCEYWRRDWHHTVNQRGVGLHLKELDNRLRYNRAILHCNDRWTQVVINRMRIGHIGLNEYLHRFHMSETEFCEQITCLALDIPETLEHFLLTCPAYFDYREALKSRLRTFNITQFDLKTLLLGSEDRMQYLIIRAVMEFVHATGRAQGYF